LPSELRTCKPVAPYPVQISTNLEQLAIVADRIGTTPRL